MSAVEVVRQAFGRLAAHRLDVEVDRHVVRALRAAAPGPSRRLVDAGLDAGLTREEAVDRAATCFLAFSTFNLSDDLSDGDCDYVPAAPAQAVVLILNALFVAALREHHLSSEVEGNVLRDLVAAEEAQVLESSSTHWDVARLGVVTDGIAGRQWSAYLRVMWAGTPMEPLAPHVAQHIGRAALLAGDIAVSDPRFVTLSPVDRRSAVHEAIRSVEALESVAIQLTRAVVAECRPVLVQELAEGTVAGSS